MTAYRYGMKEQEKQAAKNPNKEKFPIVCLCGSTRFKKEFEKAAAELSLRGCIVLSLGVFGKSGDYERYDIDENDEKLREQLNDMHKQRIEMSDAVYVVNPGGYVGESTKREIEYARSHGKDVLWLEELSVGEMELDENGELVYVEIA